MTLSYIELVSFCELSIVPKESVVKDKLMSVVLAIEPLFLLACLAWRPNSPPIQEPYATYITASFILDTSMDTLAALVPMHANIRI